VAVFLILAFAVTFLASPFAEARNISRKRQALYNARLKASRRRSEAHLPKAQLQTLLPSTPAPRLSGSPSQAPTERTLLDEVGKLAHDVPQGQVDGWMRELKTGGAKGLRAGWLHLWLGEYELAHSEEPLRASWHFRAAQGLAPRADHLYGLAVFDQAVSLFYQGRYEQASGSFERLLHNKEGLRGAARRETAFWLKHARAAWGYHEDRKKLGITEPERLDPLCAAAGLAVCLRALGLPYDRKTVLPACRVTGMGSNAQDLLDACKKLGVSGRLVTADERGLKALPMPLVAYVEHDHFLAVTGASAKGVAYLCSDCGCWPGGKREVSWRQWRAMEATVYLSVQRKDSPEDRLLSTVLAAKGKAPGVKLAANGPVTALRNLGRLQTLIGALRGHVALFLAYAQAVTCGCKPTSQRCCSCMICCFMHGGGPSGKGGGKGGQATFSAKGATSGDPVNLATGEEEYTPEPDLEVYNPKGPPVVWQRLYNSLRGPDDTYESDDFGVGWSHQYNFLVYDSAFGIHPQAPQNGSLTFAVTGSDAPAGTLSWDIVQNGTTIATNLAANGWTVTLGSLQVTVGAPLTAAATPNYKVRTRSGMASYSAFFDVLPANTIPRGATRDFTPSGALTPDTANGSWDIYRAGHLVASANQPNGWTVNWQPMAPAGATLTLTPPVREVATTGFAVRAVTTTLMGAVSGSLTVAVVENRFVAQASTKYLIMPNGSRISLSPTAVPSATLTSVDCPVPAGAPFKVTWFYQSDNPLGSYEILFEDGSQLYTTRIYKAVSGGAGCFCVERLMFSTGSGIFFNYATGIANSGFPTLSSIVDYQTRSSVLLTVNRATNGTGNITSVADASGRSVYYLAAGYTTTNVPHPWPQSYQEVTHVSQVVATGTTGAPDRWAYAYANVFNGEGTAANNTDEWVPFLTEIHVPSPADGQDVKATIAYEPSTCYVTSITDANGNKTEFTAVDASHTKVTIKNAAGTVVYSYTAGFDLYMNETSLTDGSNSTVVDSRTYNDADNPYKPSAVTDGNLRVTSYDWDTYGRLLQVTSPRGIVTAYTWDNSVFPLKRLTGIQTTGAPPLYPTKTATTLSYYEPSGRVQNVYSPTPGGTGTVQTTAAYDTLGNLTSVTAPGNNAAGSITTSYNYTSDGLYSQTAAVGQPVKITDNLGKVTHFRYDARGNRTVLIDALGNETDTTYNLADQPLQVTYPATAQTGTGRAARIYSYLYPGGPMTAETLYDESGVQARQVTFAYGKEGELLSRGGSAEPETSTYDGAYRRVNLKDGKNNAAVYQYDTAGNFSRLYYPAGGLDNVAFTLYDPEGNLLRRQDGGGPPTTPTPRRTGISPASPTLPAAP
jgi:YD repeat-containing protein